MRFTEAQYRIGAIQKNSFNPMHCDWIYAENMDTFDPSLKKYNQQQIQEKTILLAHWKRVAGGPWEPRNQV